MGKRKQKVGEEAGNQRKSGIEMRRERKKEREKKNRSE